jgi:hypothetical protein
MKTFFMALMLTVLNAGAYGQNSDTSVGIIKAISYYRKTPFRASIELRGKIRFSPIFQKQMNSMPGANPDDIYAPDDTESVVFWCSDGQRLSFDVRLLGNLDRDSGLNSYFLVERRIVVSSTEMMRFQRFRRVIKEKSGNLKEDFSSVVSISDPINFGEDGIWEEGRVHDPKYLMYFFDDKPLDRLLQSYKNVKITDLTDKNGKYILISANKSINKSIKAILSVKIKPENDYMIQEAKLYIDDKGKKSIVSSLSNFEMSKIGNKWLPKRSVIVSYSEKGEELVHREVIIKPILPGSKYLLDVFNPKWESGTQIVRHEK